MSLKLSTYVSLEDWSNYIKANMQHIVKWAKLDLELQGILIDVNVNRCVELIYQLNCLMEDQLGYRSPISGRFAPKFSRYLFFDVEKDGALHVIVRSCFQYFNRHKLQIDFQSMSHENFKLFYSQLYDELLEHKFIDQQTFLLQLSPELLPEATRLIQHFRGDVVDQPEEADFILRDYTDFVPQIPSDFVEAAEKQKQNDKMAQNFIDLNKYSSQNKYFLRLTEQVENKKTKNSIIAHVRCIPQDFDVALPLKDFINIRQKQTETQQALDLDEFPDKIFYKNDTSQPIILPYQYLTDSRFFNEFLLPYDYVNSIQELNIEKAQQKYVKKPQFQEATSTSQLSHVEQWKCRLRQAENRPPHRHQLNTTLVRGFEAYNSAGGLRTGSIVRAQQEKETSTHLHVLLQSGVMFAGVPVDVGVRSRMTVGDLRGRQVAGRPKRQRINFSDDATMGFYVRYYQKLDFSVHTNAVEVLAALNGTDLPVENTIQLEAVENRHQTLQIQSTDANEALLRKPEHLAAVQQERFRIFVQNGTVVIPPWFTTTKVADEERHLVEDGVSEKQLIEVRNMMIAAWRALPHIRLGLGSIAEVINVDYFALKRIYNFYNECGLVNHAALVMKSTLPVPKFQNPLPAFQKHQFVLTCSQCQMQFTAGYFSNISKFVCAACFSQVVEQDKFCQVKTSEEWSQADNLVLLEKIRQNLQYGLRELFYIVGDQLGISAAECLSQFIKLSFGKVVKQADDPVESRNPNEVMAKAIVLGRMEEARGLLELEKALE